MPAPRDRHAPDDMDDRTRRRRMREDDEPEVPPAGRSVAFWIAFGLAGSFFVISIGLVVALAASSSANAESLRQARQNEQRLKGQADQVPQLEQAVARLRSDNDVHQRTIAALQVERNALLAAKQSQPSTPQPRVPKAPFVVPGVPAKETPITRYLHPEEFAVGQVGSFEDFLYDVKEVIDDKSMVMGIKGLARSHFILWGVSTAGIADGKFIRLPGTWRVRGTTRYRYQTYYLLDLVKK